MKPLILNDLFGQITDEVRGDANTYLMITAISIPFLALYNVGAAVIIITFALNKRNPIYIKKSLN
ncbi:hypothetical protein K1726_18725 [Clostridium estertheticum]|nr:hypothetical protein [Clostridium estertheticum]MBX4266653.1 hypothetical protein [Clostridium estertheticum]